MSLNSEFFNKINQENQQRDNFVKSNLIREQIKFLFPNLKKDDYDILLSLSTYLINFISEKFYFTKEINYINVWKENNYRNIKSAVLKILPFIDDKNNFQLYKKINDLNQILIYVNVNEIPDDVNTLTMNESLKSYFPISNFTLGLLGSYKKEKLKFFNENGERLILDIIHHNFISLLESIKICSSKLYINWINIIPIHLETLFDSEIYKKTIDDYKKISTITDNTSYRNFEKSYNGLNIADFYNVYRNGYFQNIKNVKWLLFNKIPQDSIQSKPIGKYYIQLTDKYFDISDYLENLRYSSLNIDMKNKFEINFNKFKLLILSNFESLEMAKTIIMFLINNYNYRNLINASVVEEYKLNPVEKEKTEIEDHEYNKKLIEKINKKTTKEIVNDLELVGVEHFYNYILESIDQFKSTIYSSFLFDNENRIKQDFFNIIIKNNDGTEIETNMNLKNLYNIAKTISFKNNDNNWIIQKEFFVSLSLDQRIHFFNKFTNESTEQWLNIKKNIKSQIQNTTFNESSIYNNIKNSWNQYKVYFVFYYLCNKGLLSKFTPNPNATNDQILPSNYSSKIKTIGKEVNKTIKKENLEEAYYYLNNKKYKELDVTYQKKDEKIVMNTYFDRLEKDLNWYTFYAMDWMAQISFFHTYINHQILFITGSTGTGKSTQVPKLLLYALKCIDYRENGKISCTQPRIPPTVSNAKRISEELGVPIKIFDSNLDSEIKSDNFHIQYKHQNDEHTSISNSLQLKITTDGTLFEEIVENTVMKERLFDKKKENDEFSLMNKYDIIIVDEAHEHGKNMDLILTLARNTCYYNNSVRLVIVSATMEDDEPNYRAYYKYINDNMLYPIKKPLIKHPLLEIDNFLPQTIFMDRRFHISKPGETTQFTITEVEKYSIRNEEMYKRPWDVIQEKSYEVVNDIFNSNPSGNILLFLTGENEIRTAVENLNKIIPNDAVAIPFFGTMNDKYKEIISDIDKKISEIKNQKLRIHEEWGKTYKQGNTNNNYKRAVIIATNVAEASVTIPNLKFVVDNGYSKQNNFFYAQGESILSEEMISNSSRVQRKGRVGRTSDGTIYYLYDISTRVKIPTRYNISFEDFSNEFIKLTQHKSDEKYYNDQENSMDPYKKNSFIFEYNDNTKTNSILKIIRKQFYIDSENIFENDIFNYDLYFPSKFFDYEYTPSWIINQYHDGFISDFLNDIEGELFIIHPFEKSYERNIFRQFINLKIINRKLLNNRITIPNYFLNRLLINFRIAKTDEIYRSEDKEKINIYKKTYLSKKIEEFIRSFGNIDYSLALTILCSNSINLMDEVLSIISILEAVNYNIENLYNLDGMNYIQTKKFFNNIRSNSYQNYKSDLEYLLKICDNFKSIFKLKNIFNNEKSNKLLKTEYQKIVEVYSKSKSKNTINEFKSNIIKKIGINTFQILKTIDKQEKIGTKEGYQEWYRKDTNVDKIFEDITDSELKNFCKTYNFNITTIKKFYKNFIKYNRLVQSLDYRNDPMYDLESPLIWIKNLENNFKISFSNMDKFDKVINLFLIGYSQNVCLKKNITDGEIKYFKITTYSDKISGEINKYNYRISDSNFINNKSSLIFYLKLNLNKQEISFISNISERNLIISNPFYYNPFVIKKLIILNNEFNPFLKEIYTNDNPVFRAFLNNLINLFSIDKIIWNNNQFIPYLTKHINYIKKIDE